MKALFIQQDHVSPVGPVGERFAELGYDIEEFLVVPAENFHAPGIEVRFPDPLDYDAIVPMGAPWSVYDERTIGAWILEELSVLRRAQEHGVPILGICFGGQALAAALGGTVDRAPAAEIGWHRVNSTDPDLVEEGPWFEWHYDRWTSPPESITIATTSVAPQAFVIGRSLAVQFHPELTAAMLRGWYDNGGEQFLVGYGIDPVELLAETVAGEPEAIARSRRLVDRFVTRVAKHDAL